MDARGALQPVVAGPQKRRALLAILLLRAGQLVSADVLIGELWSGHPPRTASHVLQTYVSELRKALDSCVDGSGALVVTKPPGYVLDVDPDAVDVHRFERLVSDGRRLVGSVPDQASGILGEALELWRGEPLADFRYEPFAQSTIDRLADTHVLAREARAEAEVACGGHVAVLGDLERLFAEHPLRERLAAQLMLALYRCGRQADALAVYRGLRRRLAEELGLEPGRPLQELERAMLRRDPHLDLDGSASQAPLQQIDLPRGTVTFLCTDVVSGSTSALRRSLSDATELRGGAVVDARGDGFLCAFPTASGAVETARAMQAALAGGGVLMRLGLSTGEAELTRDGYVGPEVHRAARICAAAHGGQILLAASTRELVDAPDVRDVGEHLLPGFGLAQRLFQVGSGEHPPLSTLHRPLPRWSPTPFVGRTRDLLDIGALVQRAGVRLVTLTGPGGSGKTRLAQELARRVGDAFADGVRWVDLTALRDADAVPDAIGSAVGGSGAAAGRIGDRRMLLVLDNFEHVITAAVRLAELLGACANLAMVVTSREALNLEAEHRYAVEPLPTADAISLFRHRAAQLGPPAGSDEEVAAICERLDCLPLAIELAAARTPTLVPADLLDRLDRLRLSMRGSRDAPERQRTLRSALDWSHELLTPAQRTLFARLAVFRGGCTLDAAETVCEASVDELCDLVDRSLVTQAGARMVMLDTIREYAAERFATLPDRDDVSDRHARWYADLAVRVREQVEATPGGTRWRGAYAAAHQGLERDMANLVAAIEWELARGDVRAASVALGALVRSGFFVFGQAPLARRLLDAVLGAPGGTVDHDDLAQCLAEAGHLAYVALDLARAEAYADRLLRLGTETGDRLAEINGRDLRAALAIARGDIASAAVEADRVLRISREIDSPHICAAIFNAGYVQLQGGEYERALESFELSLEHGIAPAAGWAHVAYAALALRDVVRAREAALAAVEHARSAQLGGVVLSDVLLAASAAHSTSHPMQSALVLGALDALSLTEGIVHPETYERGLAERTVRSLEAAIGGPALEAARRRGRSLTIDDVVHMLSSPAHDVAAYVP
jgi:predicted ATPase/DNA-binding SARP family transcriptional activator